MLSAMTDQEDQWLEGEGVVDRHAVEQPMAPEEEAGHVSGDFRSRPARTALLVRAPPDSGVVGVPASACAASVSGT